MVNTHWGLAFAVESTQLFPKNDLSFTSFVNAFNSSIACDAVKVVLQKKYMFYLLAVHEVYIFFVIKWIAY